MPAIGRALEPSASNPGSGPWHLRELTLADAPALARLERQLFPDEAWSLNMLIEEITHPDRRYIAAVNEIDQVLGYAGILHSSDTADIQTIGTIRQRNGIGRALLRWCEDAAAALGAERILLEVREDNAPARALYERSGYEALGIRRGYYHTLRGSIDAVVMEKPLNR